MRPTVFSLGLMSIVLGLTFFTPGCSSGNKVADQASLQAAKQVPPPTMVAETTFFEEKVFVEVALARGFRPRMVRPGTQPSRYGSSGVSTVYTFGDTGEDEEDTREVFIPRMSNSTLPPVALRLRLSNLTQAPLDVQFIECKSALGNFAVRPEKITIAPGESAQPDPMISLLGVSAQEIPVSLTLRVAGKTETRVTSLEPVRPAAKKNP